MILKAGNARTGEKRFNRPVKTHQSFPDSLRDLPDTLRDITDDRRTCQPNWQADLGPFRLGLGKTRRLGNSPGGIQGAA